MNRLPTKILVPIELIPSQARELLESRKNGQSFCVLQREPIPLEDRNVEVQPYLRHGQLDDYRRFLSLPSMAERLDARAGCVSAQRIALLNFFSASAV
jgi:hypothetical protein